MTCTTTAADAQNLQLRSQTMLVVSKWFDASGLTQAAAAKTLGVTQPRLNQLLKGKIGEFSLDALVNMATRAGMRVGLTIRPVAGVKARSGRPEAERQISSGNAPEETRSDQLSLDRRSGALA